MNMIIMWCIIWISLSLFFLIVHLYEYINYPIIDYHWDTVQYNNDLLRLVLKAGEIEEELKRGKENE